MGKKRTKVLFMVLGMIIVLYQAQGFCSFYDNIQVDTRTLALGNSYAADLNSNFVFNPSVLGNQGRLEFAHTFSSNPILELSSSLSTLRFGSFGVAYSKLEMDNVATQKYKEQLMSASFGSSFSKFNFGATINRYQMELGSDFEDAVTTLDLAILKTLGAKINLGLGVENLLALKGESSQAPAIEPVLRAGMNFNPNNKLSINIDIDSEQKAYLGLESTLSEGIQARAGYNEGVWSLGCGLSNEKLALDFAYLWGGLIGEHILTLKTSF